MKHIFISYSPKDTKTLAEMQKQLLNAGFKPWIDPAPRPGAAWRFTIDDAIRASDALLLLLTPASAESIYSTYEWTLALALNIPVIAVQMRPTSNMHPRLNSLERLDATGFKEPLQFWDYFNREMRRLSTVIPSRGLMKETSAPAMKAVVAPPPPSAPRTPDYNRSVMPTESGHWLVIRRGPNLNKMFQLTQDIVSLGRDDTNDVSIDDPEVSRYHMRFQWRDGIYTVEDLGSTNGTVIQGRRITQETPLTAGTALKLGESILLSYEVVP